MITSDFYPKRTAKKGLIRIKLCEPTKKLTAGKVVINSINERAKFNMRVEFGLGDLKRMIRQFEKESKFRK